MKHWRLALAAAVLTVLSVPSGADERVVEQAEEVIARLITSSLEWERVTFSEAKEQFLSFSEARVVGEGYASGRQDWSGMRFRFSVKVHRKELSARDARVEFEDGRVLTGYDNWTDALPPSSSRVRIFTPRRFERLSGRTVRFSGISANRKSVTVIVYDRSGRERGRRRVGTDRSGRWSTELRLEPGSYRAEAASDRWASGDEVRFSVERRESDWGFGGSGGSWGGSGGTRVTIERPRNGETLSDSIPRLSGRSDAREVNVVVYSGSRLVDRSTQKVFGGNWSAGPRLGSGSYRLVVENRDGRGRAEVRFYIRSGDFGGSGGSGGSSVSIDRPRNGDRVGEGSIGFSGRSNADQVAVSVYLGSRRVYSTTRSVRGGSWSASTRLRPGSYRLVVQNVRGRGSDEARFEVRSSGFGGSGGSGGSVAFGGSGGSGGFGGSGGTGICSVSIESPRNGQAVGAGRIGISGRSSASQVNVTVYRGSSTVHRTTLRVSGGRWSTSVSVSSGSYRVVAEAASGRGSSEARFNVR